MESNLLEIRAKYLSGILNKVDYAKQCQAHHAQLFDYSEFMKKTDIRSIEITDNGVCMTTREMGIKMMANRIDRGIAPVGILNSLESEENEVKVLKNLLKRNYEGKFVMIDVGANIGWYSMNFAKSFPKSQIYSFEPIPESYANILSNIALNNLTNITTIHSGVSDHEGVETFYYDTELSGNASLTNLSEKKNVSTVNAQLITLDNYCSQKSIKPDFIKVDVEGAELFVFKGARKIISDNHPIVFAEMLRKWSSKFGYHPNQIIALFKELDYKCYTLCKEQLIPLEIMTDSTEEKNFIFLNQKYHKI
ncbi:MAG: FkbM family methyltransferase [Nanoarchaeota archaeon]